MQNYRNQMWYKKLETYFKNYNKPKQIISDYGTSFTFTIFNTS